MAVGNHSKTEEERGASRSQSEGEWAKNGARGPGAETISSPGPLGSEPGVSECHSAAVSAQINTVKSG